MHFDSGSTNVFRQLRERRAVSTYQESSHDNQKYQIGPHYSLDEDLSSPDKKTLRSLQSTPVKKPPHQPTGKPRRDKMSVSS
mmetsp:Transcript_37739/g.53238  ORF Transcript_37739/g.53238 Transcript_37739/m.53238 type:complete len:82 (+) Transcript_37739:1090-1335(+)